MGASPGARDVTGHGRRLLDRPSFISPWVVAMVSRYGLPFWFAIESILGVAVAAKDTTYLFFDARLYLEAALARRRQSVGCPARGQLLRRAAPDAAGLRPVHAAAGRSCGRDHRAGRRRRRDRDRPNASPAVVVAALPAAGPGVSLGERADVDRAADPPPGRGTRDHHQDLCGTPAADPGSMAIAADRGRRHARDGAVAAVGHLPREFGLISQRLADQSKLTLPIGLLLLLSPLVVAALIVVGRERAAWLVVPAIWPSQQFYYGTIAMPTRSKIATALIALPVPGNGLLALGALALVTIVIPAPNLLASRCGPPRDETDLHRPVGLSGLG